MPDFIFDHKVFYNPVEFANHFIGGTWKMPILYRLNKQTMRYSELKRTLPHISAKMLSSQLKELEAHGFLLRQQYNEVPPRVEYTITDLGRKAIPVIEVMRQFGYELMALHGIEDKKKAV